MTEAFLLELKILQNILLCFKWCNRQGRKGLLWSHLWNYFLYAQSFFSCVAFQYILFFIVNKFHVAWLQTKRAFLIKNPRDYFITHISHKQADRNQLLFFLTCIAITFVHLNSCLPFLNATPFSYSLLRSLGLPGASVDPPQQKTFQSSKWAASKRRIPALSQPVELPWCLRTLAYQSLSVQKTRVPRQFW